MGVRRLDRPSEAARLDYRSQAKIWCLVNWQAAIKSVSGNEFTYKMSLANLRSLQ